jgi:hypothetical protein
MSPFVTLFLYCVPLYKIDEGRSAPVMSSALVTEHGRSVAHVLNNARLYKMGADEYLEPGLFKVDPWVFFPIINNGSRQLFKIPIINNW